MRRARDESGAAMVEFVSLVVIMVIPLAYLLLTVFEVQRASFAASSAVREAARLFVTAPSSGDGEVRARQALALTLADHGMAAEPDSLTISCAADPCLTPAASVRVEFRTRVMLPLVPGFVADLVPVSVNVQAAHTQIVDRYAPIRP